MVLLAGGLAALGVRQHRSSERLGAVVSTAADGRHLYSGRPWDGHPAQGMTTDELAEFSQFPLYWLGTAYQGLNLTVALSAPGNAMLIYGTCGPPSCTPPLSISMMPACKLQPGQVATASTTETLSSGAVLVRFGDPGRIMLWSGGSTLNIQAAPMFSIASILAGLEPISGSEAGLSAPDFASCS